MTDDHRPKYTTEEAFLCLVFVLNVARYLAKQPLFAFAVAIVFREVSSKS
jgi:hypothetical protein